MRRASALLAVVSATAVLAILVFAFFGATRGQGRLVHRAAHAEAAYQLALSGVDAMLAGLAQRMQPGKGLDGVREGLPAALEGHIVRLDSDQRDSPLAGLVAWLAPEVDARVKVTATFRGWRSVEPAGFRSPAGTIADPAEKTGLVEIVSVATCGGAVRQVECFKAARIVRPLPPLLTRFTLFVKQPPERPGELAAMEIQKRALFPQPAGALAPSATHDALVVSNSTEKYVAGELAKRWLDRTGWIFLGGDGERRWVFDLAFGGGPDQPFGESFHLCQQAVYVTQDRSVAGTLTADGERALAEHDRLLIRTGVHAAARAESLFANAPLEPPVRAASLHLFGSAKAPSPTIVLGRAYRRSLLHAYLATKSHDRVLGLPYVHAPAEAPLSGHARAFGFEGDGVPPFTRARVLEGIFADRVGPYQKFMSRPVVEPYSRSIDHIERNVTAPEAADAFDPPYALTGMERVTRRLEPVDPDPGRRRTFLYAVDANARARVLDPQRKPVFEGDLGELSPVDLLLPERTTYVFRGADFARWTAAGTLRVKGIMALHPSEPDLAIARPLEVLEGGVIVARGNIDIDAPITTTGPRPLTLVALEGRIRVRAPRVDAFLVALGESGVIERTGDGPLALSGGLAATRLDVPSFARGVADPPRITRTLTYDARGDARGLGFYMDSRRVVVLR